MYKFGDDLQRFFNAVRDPLALLTQDLSTVSMNPPGLHFFPCDANGNIRWETALGAQMKDSVHRAQLTPPNDNSESATQEMVIMAEFDGVLKPVVLRVRPFRFGSSFNGLLLHALPLSTKVLEELKLDLSVTTERVSLALQSRNIGFWDWDIEKNILHWDQIQYKIFGQESARFTSNFDAWSNTLAPEDKERALAEVQAALVGERKFDTEFDIILPDGERRTIRGTGFAYRDADGKPVRMIGLNWDVTDRRRIERDLIAQNRWKNKITETIPSLLWVQDLKTRKINFYNGKFVEALQYSRQEIDQSSSDFVASVIFPADVARYSEVLSKILSLQDGQVVERELRFVRKDQQVIWLQTRSQVFEVNDMGVPISMVFSAHDITEQKRAQEASEVSRANAFHSSKLAALGEMAGGIAHEINNPLAVIVAKVELVRKTLSEQKLQIPQVDQHLEKISTMIIRISKIIRSLKTIARNEENDTDVQRIKVEQLFDDVLTLSQQRRQQYNVDLQVDNQTNHYIDVRFVHMSQILLNLLNNSIDAIKTLPARWIKIQVTETGNFIDFAVIDSGPGIPIDIASRMMEPFYTTKSVGEGTGLGLSISAALAKQLGGNLRYDSSSANTKFVLTLPKQQKSKDSKHG